MFTFVIFLFLYRKLSFILNKLNKEIDGSKDQHKKYTKVLKKLKASSKSDKQNSDLSDDSPFTVFTAFYNHVPRIIEILKNESLLQEQKRYLIKHLLEN